MPAALSNILRSYRSPTSAVLRIGCERALPGHRPPDLPEALTPMIGRHGNGVSRGSSPAAGAGSSAGR